MFSMSTHLLDVSILDVKLSIYTQRRDKALLWVYIESFS